MAKIVRPVLALAACAGGMLLLASCGVRVTAPTAYVECDSPDGVFRCDVPADWDINGKGKQYPGMTVSRGNVEMRIETHPVDAKLLDSEGAAGTKGGEVQEAGQPLPLRVHDAAKTKFTRYMPDYAERATTSVETALGEGRVSEFTYSERITGRVHGYRGTVVLGDKWVQVSCTCPEGDWVTLQPAFDHVISSLRPGEGRSK